MNCVDFGFTVPGDVNNHLKNAVVTAAKEDSVKARILVGYISSPEFLEWAKTQPTVYDQLSKNPNKPINSVVDINGQRLPSLLNEYYKSKHPSVKNDVSNTQASPNKGFLSARAKEEARAYSVDLFIETYYSMITKDNFRNTKKNKLEIINKIIEQIKTKFIGEEIPILIDTLKSGNDTKAKKAATELEKAYKELNDERTKLNKINKQISDINKLKKDNKEYDVNLLKELKENKKALVDKIITLQQERYIKVQNFVNEFGGVRYKNFANLVSQIKQDPNGWFIYTLTHSKITSLVNEFKELLNEEKIDSDNYIDEDDANINEQDSLNRMTANWEEGIRSSFNKYIATDVKLYLETLKVMTEPAKVGDDAKNYKYFTNNTLGVPQSIGRNLIISQLIAHADLSSVSSFVESVNRIANDIPRMAGLSKLYIDMINNPVFANKVFTSIKHPLINKTTIMLNANGIDFVHNNRDAFSVANLTFQMFNAVKNRLNDNYDPNDTIELQRIKTILGQKGLVLSNELKQEYNYKIKQIFNKYFPNINFDTIIAYIAKNGDNQLNNYYTVINDLLSLINTATKIIDDYQVARNNYYAERSEWNKRKQKAERNDKEFTEPEPTLKLNKVNFESLNLPIIKLAKIIANYNINKIDLNGTNAQGNNTSNIINNSFLTNFFDQINNKDEAKARQGLENLMNEIILCPQYNEMPIFYGIKNAMGQIVIPGLFEKTKTGYKINDNAFKLLRFSLFDGVKNENTDKALLYKNMSKGDYFMAQLIAFTNPFKFDTLMEEKDSSKINDFYGGYFMRTPSDAPKNFIIQAPKIKTTDLWKITNKIKYLRDRRVQINNLVESVDDYSQNLLLKGLKAIKNENYNNAEYIYKLLNGQIKRINYDYLDYFIEDEDSNEVFIPLLYKYDNRGKDKNATKYAMILVSGQKVRGTEENIVTDLKIIGATGNNKKLGLEDSFFNNIEETLINEGINNGEISYKLNIFNLAYCAFVQNLRNELHTFVDQLNQIFEYDSNNGVWITKTNVQNLFDRAHYNKGNIVNDGKLTGNLFKFVKLFNANDYDVNNAMEQALSLYGGVNDSLFVKTDDGRLMINPERLKAKDLVVDVNGKLTLNINAETNTKLQDITETWLNNYRVEIVNRINNFAETLAENNIKQDVAIDYLLNATLAYYNFDCLFEGDSKFYKNAQDFLKRAKEAQAGGDIYTGFDITSPLSQPIEVLKDNNGKDIEIGVDYDNSNSSYYLPRRRNDDGTITTGSPLKARNGFKAITIRNIVSPARYAGQIKDEVKRVLLNQGIDEKFAEQRATEIAKGYYENTALDDAQSYITLDEFVRRRFADGSIGQYKELLQEITDVRLGKKSINDINLTNINARIQIQKNYYYDLKRDEKTGLRYPRQIKNAEFVLIPELLESTQLEQLYNIMEKYGIDQVNTEETSKAAKKNIMDFFIFDKESKETKINENFEQELNDNKDSVIEDFYYRYLYKQQEVPQHLVDASNKAGIQLLKKISDNSVENDDNIKKFFRLYSANIKQSFRSMLNSMGWKVNEDGSLSSMNGQATLDFNEFYAKARQQAQITGLDSNFVEYLTPQDFDEGKPLMANFMNNFETKLESIAQSIFNNAITRQTLPGYHAAQVTSIAHGVRLEDGTYRSLKYHPAITDENGNVIQEAYAEILVPRWSAKIGKEVTIEDLAKVGLDMQIGYRIPTEGKQSVSIFKVVGFLDDIYGSTVMVPDEWVIQTGSDFDVDSIYFITYNIIKDKEGNLHKIEINNGKTEEDYQNRYIAYIKDEIKTRIPKNEYSKEEIKNKYKELYDRISNVDVIEKTNNTLKEQFKETNNLFNTFDSNEQKIIAKGATKYKNINDKIGKHQALAKRATILAQTEKDATKKANFEKYAKINQEIADNIELIEQSGIEFLAALKKGKENIRSEAYKKFKEERFNDYKKAAKNAGLVSYEEFKTWSIEEQNSKDARDNAILDSMIAIMESDNSREENFSRSNFDTINEVKKEKEDYLGVSADNFSAHNPLDQIEFFERATSGLSIKAISVSRDNFCSINNRVKGKLSGNHKIDVKYKNSKYSIINAIASYGWAHDETNTGIVYAYDKNGNEILDENKLNETDYYIVKHDSIGHSRNNRNISGNLVTVYSSQTTAHILDAMKTGAIINENIYTFGTFKTLVDLGIDYDTAIGFLMQPGVSRIVENYQRKNSLFNNINSDPIQAAVKSIARDLGITINGKLVNDYSNMKDVYSLLSKNKQLQNAFMKLFGATLHIENGLDNHFYVLDSEMLDRRLKSSILSNNSELSEEDKYYEDIAFDLAMIINFNKYYKTTQNIEAIARCCNPDKFGAKQTLFDTRKVLEEIVNLSEASITEIQEEDGEEKEVIIENPIAATIMVGDKTIIDAIYPNVRNDNIDIVNSKYMYLASFLQYSTIPSVKANSQLFVTEQDGFIQLSKLIERKLGIKFTDKIYKQFKQYAVNDLYYSVPYLTIPLTVNDSGHFVVNFRMQEEQVSATSLGWNPEIGRIFGYDMTQSKFLPIKDINNPTVEEIHNFNKLTPGQKVDFIQRNFTEDKGYFGFISVNNFNQNEFKEKGFTTTKLKFADEIDSIEEILESFSAAFFHKNPLIKLTALDVLKYAFLVEGFKFKKNGISKTIINRAIYSDIQDGGIDLMDSLNYLMDNFITIDPDGNEAFVDKFIRSHSELIKEVKFKTIYDKNSQETNLSNLFNKYVETDGLVYIPFEKEASEILEAIKINDESVPKEYVRITRNEYGTQTTTIYKIYDGLKDDLSLNGIYFIPLNKLDANECTEYSVNSNNNRFKDYPYYKALIDYTIQEGISARLVTKKENREEHKEINKLRFESTIKKHIAKSVSETLTNPNELIRISKEGSLTEQGIVNKFIKDVADYLNLPVEEQNKFGIIHNPTEYIKNMFFKGINTVQNIPTEKGIKRVYITPVDISKAGLGYFKTGKISRTLTNTEKIAIDKAKEGKAVFPKLYKITIAFDEKVKENYVNDVNENKPKREPRKLKHPMFSLGGYETQLDDAYNLNEVEEIALKAYNEVKRQYFRTVNTENPNRNAGSVIEKLKIKGLDVFSSKSIKEHNTNIYKEIAYYYDTMSKIILDKLDKFVIDGEEYSVDKPELYEKLKEHPDAFIELTKLLLDAKTFGDQFAEILNIGLDSLDSETSAAITKLRNAINSVKNNTKMKQGIGMLFNNYIAEEFSTNPLIREGIIDLRTTFADVHGIDLNLSDIGELSHKQIQTVIKYIYSIVNSAITITAPKAAADFRENWDAIEKKYGKIDTNKFITEKGMFKTGYNEQFLQDKQRVIDAVTEARQNYGIDSIQYVRAKLERDEWFANNINQEIVPEYYHKINANLRKILRVAPNDYVQYMKYCHELNDNAKPFNEMTEDEKATRKALIQKIKAIRSSFNEDGTLKSNIGQQKAAALREFIENKKRINSEYFIQNERIGFKENLDYHLSIIENYERNHPEETLDLRLQNSDYAASFDWINSNTHMKLDDDSNAIIQRAYNVLQYTGHNRDSGVREIIEQANARDANGIIDARKLTSEQIAKIKAKSSYALSDGTLPGYGASTGDELLIKNIPEDLPVFDDTFYTLMRDPSEQQRGVNANRLNIIREINKLLEKCIGTNGRFDAKSIFETLTDEELDKLDSLYTRLKQIKSNRSKEWKEKFRRNVNFKTNDSQFLIDLNYASSNLSAAKFKIFQNIFVEHGKNGAVKYRKYKNGVKEFMPSDQMYGYILPKDNKYINHEKTEARKILRDNIQKEPTEYYYAKYKEMSLKPREEFLKWYKDNHVYNPYTRKNEPLCVWTRSVPKPGSTLKMEYSYIPTWENLDRYAKNGNEASGGIDVRNPNYIPNSENYNFNNPNYNTVDNLTEGEKELMTLMKETLSTYATTYEMQKFINKGFLPRKYKQPIDKDFMINNFLGMFGLNLDKRVNSWTKDPTYANDRDSEFEMLQLIKQKGFKEVPERPKRSSFNTDKEYDDAVKSWNETKTKIEEENLRLDNAVLDRDWKNVFDDFIRKAVEYNAKNRIKNVAYLLLEDLKSNPTFEVSRLTGNLKKENKNSTDEFNSYSKIKQNNAYALTQNWLRRYFFGEFKKDNKMVPYANFMQNITSAKYMVFNVTGGIANIGTGMANIFNEVCAKQFFDYATFNAARGMYMSNSLNMLADMYKPTSNNFAAAITKMFNIVDFNDFNERRSNEDLATYAKRIRDNLYFMQSGGEHYMQNTVLFAMLKSHRVYTNSDGKIEIGSFGDYIRNIEISTMRGLLAADENYITNYNNFIKKIKRDKNLLHKYDTFREDINQNFLNEVGNEDLRNRYIKARKEAIVQAKKDFATNPTLESQLVLKNGIIVLAADSKINENMIGEFRSKVIRVNKKIHGVYDKIGAAKIESEWWGSLVMQYHKHIYPGIMKRWRTKGYYNEISGNVEYGSYVQLANFLSYEFRRTRNNNRDMELTALESIQSYMKATINTFLNMSINYKTLPEWQKRNMARCWGDLIGIGAAILISMMIYALTDDDDLKESESLATALYVSDRLLAEAQMYTPWGLFTEGKTLWSSPIAAQNTPKDLIKALGLTASWLFEEDFNINYTTGLYKGQNKIAVLAYRNTPAWRIWQRLSTMTKNNSYYRLNENALNMKVTKYIADMINPD